MFWNKTLAPAVSDRTPSERSLWRHCALIFLLLLVDSAVKTHTRPIFPQMSSVLTDSRYRFIVFIVSLTCSVWSLWQRAETCFHVNSLQTDFLLNYSQRNMNNINHRTAVIAFIYCKYSEVRNRCQKKLQEVEPGRSHSCANGWRCVCVCVDGCWEVAAVYLKGFL